MKRATNILIALSILCCSCGQPERLAPAEYIHYMEQDAAYKKKVDAGNTQYTIQLALPGYMALKDAYGFNKELNADAYSKRIKELDGFIFFLVNIIKAPSGDPLKKMAAGQASTEQMVMYYESAAGDITLKDGDAELKPVTYHFENNDNLSPYNTIVVAFPDNGGNGKDLQLVFNDRYAGNPLVKASFPKTLITHPPTLLITGK